MVEQSSGGGGGLGGGGGDGLGGGGLGGGGLGGGGDGGGGDGGGDGSGDGGDTQVYIFHDGPSVVDVHESVAQMQIPVQLASKPMILFQPEPAQFAFPYARARQSSFVATSDGTRWW